MADPELQHDNLVGDHIVEVWRLPLNAGAILTRGEAVGYITATGAIDSYSSAGAGGLEVFYGIAAESVSAAAGDTRVDVYVLGKFNSNVVEGLMSSPDTVTQAFRNSAREKGIFLSPWQ